MGGGSYSERKIFGLNISVGGARDVARQIISVRPQRVELVVTPNIDHIVHLRRNVRFARAYREAAIVACDGFPVQYYAALRGNAAQRAPGTDILAELMAAPLLAHRLFFVVDCDETAASIHRWATERNVMVKTAIPPLTFECDKRYTTELVRQINEHHTTILVMGVGAPKSEVWVDTHRSALPACWALCVGQGVRVAGGVSRRAPALVRSLNCEWLWRICQEPRRLWWRYVRGLLLFPLAVAEDQLNNWLNRLAWRRMEDTPGRATSACRHDLAGPTRSATVEADNREIYYTDAVDRI